MRDTDQVRRAATVRGRVQGVSFRWYTQQEANRLRLVGWVRNDADGSVRLEVQGPQTRVDELLAWLEQGPPAAHVTAVEVNALDPSDAEIDFRISR